MLFSSILRIIPFGTKIDVSLSVLSYFIAYCNSTFVFDRQYRRNILASLGRTASPAALLTELSFLTGVIEENEKNYQVWFHRRCIIQLLCPPADPQVNILFTSHVLHFVYNTRSLFRCQKNHFIQKNISLLKIDFTTVYSIK